MLKSLTLKNIILIDEATLHFEPGLNVLTGETGAGKSAILNGIRLILGEKSDTSLIRKGEEKAVIEAHFTLSPSSHIHLLLDEAGIELMEDRETLLIKREITLSGKHRLFINHQQCQLALLKRISPYIAHVADQHATFLLFSCEFQRELIDLYGDLKQLLNQFRKSFLEEKQLKEALKTLTSNESARLREIDRYENEIQEIEEAKLKNGDEEEELFQEYQMLVNTEELSKKLNDLSFVLEATPQSMMGQLQKARQLLDQIKKIDTTFEEFEKTIHHFQIELSEFCHEIRGKGQQLEENPERLEFISSRLSFINKLKRKYGQNIEEIIAYKDNKKQELQTLLSCDSAMEELSEKIQEQEKITNKYASELTQKRNIIARELEQKITGEIVSLNMPHAEFKIVIHHQQRTQDGDDKIDFYLSPNLGENGVLLKEAASGGELSRILLAIYTLIANKEQIPIRIFDEIDANIGGETAKIIADKFLEMAKTQQILCITHFSQVASQAHHHIKIFKINAEGRTVTKVAPMNTIERQHELDRMMGKTHPQLEKVDRHILP